MRLDAVTGNLLEERQYVVKQPAHLRGSNHLQPDELGLAERLAAEKSSEAIRCEEANAHSRHKPSLVAPRLRQTESLRTESLLPWTPGGRRRCEVNGPASPSAARFHQDQRGAGAFLHRRISARRHRFERVDAGFCPDAAERSAGGHVQGLLRFAQTPQAGL